MRIRRMAVWTVTICLSGVAGLEAQPGGLRFTGGGTEVGVSPEQVFVWLAFDEKLHVTDKQLIALREAFKWMRAELHSAERDPGERDSRAMRQQMREQQSEMRHKMIMGAVATALTGEQIARVRAFMKGQMQQGLRQRDPRPFTGVGVSPEQVFVWLAYDEKLNVTDKQLNVTDEQLIALREVFKQMRAEVRSAEGDRERDSRDMRQQMREQQSEMREKIMGAVATALTVEQIVRVRAFMEGQMQQGLRQRGPRP